MYSFGSGVLIGTRTDTAAPNTPINFGLLQDVTLDFGFDNKLLFGQYQVAVAAGRGKAKFTGKAKVARVSGLAFNNLFFGQPIVGGQLATSFAEGPTAIPATPFTITVANAATFVDDLGVINAATGLPLAKVTSGPAAGQYSVNTGTGVYTFSSADNVAGVKVLINYTYTIAASGQRLQFNNQLMGVTPTFQAQFYSTFQGQAVNLKLLACVSSKLAFATKLDDFVIPEFDFDILANAAGNVFDWDWAEAS